jgi:hypothetical protein
MTYNNSSTPESTEQNTLVTTEVSKEIGQMVLNAPINLEKTLSQAVLHQHDKLSPTKKALQGFGGNLVKGVLQLSEDMAEKAVEISSDVAKSATDLGQGAVNSATEFGQGAIKSAVGFSQGVVKSTSKLGQEATKSALSQEPIREALLIAGSNTNASQAAKEATVEAHLKQVNSSNAKKFVAMLREKFPAKTSEEIAQQVVVFQTLRITGNSVAISLIPGKLAESMGFDQAALTLTQAETIYQIAEAYAFDLVSPERRVEALAIFDRAFRSFRKMKMSMNLGAVPTLPIVGGLLSAIPFLGGLLNVGSDAFLISLIGDTACQLYKAIVEEKVAGEALNTFKQETQAQYKKKLW